ncbi:MAG: hypothetical protein LBL45_12785 [Treponema sp.]|jgi:hypothetical protein|nr:hypothetical protein [Treponema sp.]
MVKQQVEPEIHAYLDDLCKRGFYGELTLYFQDGDINNYRETVRAGKNELIEKYRDQAAGQGGRKKRIMVVPLPMSAGVARG